MPSVYIYIYHNYTIIIILSCFSSERPHEPEASQTSFKEYPSRVSTTQTPQSSNSKLSTPENQLRFHLSTKGLTWRGKLAYTYMYYSVVQF